MTQQQPKILNWESFKNFFHESWHSDMKKFIESEECFNIYQKLKSEPKGSVIPKSDKLWSAFNYDKNNLKVVFMRMCPYHTRDDKDDYADGLCFSTKLKKLLQVQN